MSEGLKFDAKKPDYSLLPAGALEDIVRVYDLGVSKYGRDNWRKGIKYSRIFAAIMRHLWAWWRGSEKNEEDAGLRHLAQAAWGCLTLLEYTQNDVYKGFDDRSPTIPISASGSNAWCDHEWVYETSRGMTDGCHTTYRCKKCSGIDVRVEPASVSIPSVWVGPQSEVPYTITVSGPPLGCGTTYIMDLGTGTIKVVEAKNDCKKQEVASERASGKDSQD